MYCRVTAEDQKAEPFAEKLTFTVSPQGVVTLVWGDHKVSFQGKLIDIKLQDSFTALVWYHDTKPRSLMKTFVTSFYYSNISILWISQSYCISNLCNNMISFSYVMGIDYI